MGANTCWLKGEIRWWPWPSGAITARGAGDAYPLPAGPPSSRCGRLELLLQFRLCAGYRPVGSSDPYALRAGLGNGWCHDLWERGLGRWNSESGVLPSGHVHMAS